MRLKLNIVCIMAFLSGMLSQGGELILAAILALATGFLLGWALDA